MFLLGGISSRCPAQHRPLALEVTEAGGAAEQLKGKAKNAVGKARGAVKKNSR